MDSILIEQVLFNLMENAIRHSGSNTPIQVIVTTNGTEVMFKIIDHGKGLSMAQIKSLDTGMSTQKHRLILKRGWGLV